MTRNDSITLKRARTTARNLGYDLVPRTRTQAKPVVKASAPVRNTDDDARREAMRGKPITKGQMRAINVFERKLGYRLSTRKVIGDMRDASILRAALKAECEAEGLL